MIDRERVIQGLEYLANGCGEKPCDDCQFSLKTPAKPRRCGLQENEIERDALALLQEQWELIDLQHNALRGSSDMIEWLFAKIVSFKEPVRCRYCVYWQDNNGGYPHPECRWGHEETPDADDYCSFGSDKRQNGGHDN